MDNIFPVKLNLTKKDKEQLLNQKGLVIWMTGLSGSGKSTIAKHFEDKLYKNQIYSIILDGDNIRSGINNNLGFSADDRLENIRRVAEIAKLFCENGVVTICCFISPTIEIREMAKSIIGEDNFFEIFINASFDECANRDVKGLYEKALSGKIKNFTGLDAPFDLPENPFLVLDTLNETEIDSTDKLFNSIYHEILNTDNFRGNRT